MFSNASGIVRVSVADALIDAFEHSTTLSLFQLKSGTSIISGACHAKNNPVKPFFGNIDEVRIWNIPRTQAQILERINMRFFPRDEIIDGLIGYYRCNNGVGKMVADQSVSQQHAVMKGKVRWAESELPIEKR